MQNAEWISMLRLLPAELHSQIVLVLSNRVEVSVDVICRLEPTFIAVRGRMGGTTETGLLFLLPYDQLSGVYLSRELGDAEVQAIFNIPAAGEEKTPAAQENVDRPTPSNNGSSKVVPSFGRAPDATSVARNNLLERLRAARQAAAAAPNK